jgi:glycerol-3-phosphate dehydrogenase (NAD(P)+)
VLSCASVQALAYAHGVEMPIVEHVAAVVAGELTPAQGVKDLMGRAPGRERD